MESHEEWPWEGWGQWQPAVLGPGNRGEGRDPNFGEVHRLMRKLRIPAQCGKSSHGGVEERRRKAEDNLLREAGLGGRPGAEAWGGEEFSGRFMFAASRGYQVFFSSWEKWLGP